MVVLDCELAMAGRDPMTSLDTVETSSPFLRLEGIMERMTEREAVALTYDAVKRNLAAETIDIAVRARPSWDGVGHDVAYDVAVIWRRQSLGYGTHVGVVRETESVCLVDIFWGHYDFADEAKAIADFNRRAKDMT